MPLEEFIANTEAGRFIFLVSAMSMIGASNLSEPKANPVLNAAIMEIVDNQIRRQKPPQTAQTFKRLTAAGHSEKEARRLIPCLVSAETLDMLKKHQPFNPDRFVNRLSNLPELPWK